MIKAINLPPDHSIFIWNTSDEKDKVLALKWCIINDCIKKVYKELNIKNFTGENHTFHILHLNIIVAQPERYKCHLVKQFEIKGWEACLEENGKRSKRNAYSHVQKLHKRNTKMSDKSFKKYNKHDSVKNAKYKVKWALGKKVSPKKKI